MKKRLSLALVIAISQLSALDLSVLFKNNSFIGLSHGGSVDDIKAYSDGVGVVVKGFYEDSNANFSKYNQSVLAFGSEAANMGQTVADFVGLTGESLGSVFGEENAHPTGETVTNQSLRDLIEAWRHDKTNQEIISRIENADTSQVTDMSYLLKDPTATDAGVTTDFNLDISRWDTSNVTTMQGMFWNAEVFNQDISGWNVSKVTNMHKLFFGCKEFNQPIGSWDLSNVTDIERMFQGAEKFNQPINNWNFPNVTSLDLVFYGAKSFNQPLNNWDVSHITTLRLTFSQARDFNQDISTWNVSNVVTMLNLFDGTEAFNQPIGVWNISKVTTIAGMFEGTKSFNQPLNNWDTSSVTSLRYTFSSSQAFNQPLDNWDTSHVTNMKGTFYNAKAFSQNVGGWNVSNVTEYDDGSGFYDSDFYYGSPLANHGEYIPGIFKN